MEYISNLEIGYLELFVRAACFGCISLITILLLYFYHKTHSPVYKAAFFISFLLDIYILSGVIAHFIAQYAGNNKHAFELERISYIALVMSMPFVYYFYYQLTNRNKALVKTAVNAITISLVFAVSISILSYVYPGMLLVNNQNIFQPHTFKHDLFDKGILVMMIYIGILATIVYTIIFLILKRNVFNDVSLVTHLSVAVFVFLIFFIDDSINSHFNYQIKAFPQLFIFDHLVIGVTISFFILFLGLIKKFIDSGKQLSIVESELLQVKKTLEDHENVDTLTGLQNKKAFFEKTQQLIDHLHSIKTPFLTLLYCDIRRFKEINESLGHAAGDELIADISNRIRDTLLAKEYFFKFGSDEFVIVLTNTKEESAPIKILDKIKNQMIVPFSIRGRDLTLSLSIGVASYPKHGRTLHELVKNAHSAKDAAKKNKQFFQYYTDDLNKLSSERLTMEIELRKAITNNEIVAYYQPQVNKDGKIVGAEALARWLHPVNGLIPPLKFIPLAEEIGVISDIGNTILDQTCKLAEELKMNEDFTFSVNLSTKQISYESSIYSLKMILHQHVNVCANIEFELTESSLIENQESSVVKIDELRNLGASIGIDDFGTGYSSLAYLSKLKLNTLKIDRSFISDYPHNEQNINILKTIILLGKSLNLYLVAEGAETKEQVDFLFGQGCDAIQGFYFYKPMPVNELKKLLSQ
jgi:diguanylate cyclase (GGDEF)-like protein